MAAPPRRRSLPMRAMVWILAAAAGLAADPYGDISDLKINKPGDKVDVKSTPAPKDAVVLFDSKNLDNWVMRGDEKKPATWDVLPGGVIQARDGDIITKEQFDGHF